MPKDIFPPFSMRNRGAHSQIDSDFPESARTALIHLLHFLVEKGVDGWIRIMHELERIARVKPGAYNVDYAPDINKARANAERLLLELPWDKVLDFCERLHESLTQRGYRNWLSHIVTELNRIFLEESLAFEFRDGRVERRGRRHTSIQVSRAEIVLGDDRLESARKHFNKALRYFQDVTSPDPENAVKEAVCAVEATGRALWPTSRSKTLGDIVKSITGSEAGQLPKAVAQTFHGLYGFRSGGEGVGHGGATGGVVTQGIAEYALAIAASQIILLVDLANSQDDEVPF